MVFQIAQVKESQAIGITVCSAAFFAHSFYVQLFH